MTTDGSETHRIPVEAGESVAAVHHVAAGRRWLVFCHGFRSDKSGSYEHRCRRAVSAGYDAVRFDFRGCGDSDGAFVDQTPGDKLADLASVVDHFDPASYALFGSSFGGKVAFHAAARDDRVEAVVARAPVTYNRAFDPYRRAVDNEGEFRFEDGARLDGRFFEGLDRYPFADVLDVGVPVAMFHGARDESVPIEDSIEATAALETDVVLEKFVDEGHRFSRQGEERMLERTFDWLAAGTG